MINPSDYSCDKCAREFSRHCKHCYHTEDKIPTRFKKKKKTGVQTPEFRKPTPPPSKPNPNYVPPASVQKSCTYSTPCGWCTKWDKKCDKKIESWRGQRVKINPIDDAIDEPIETLVNKMCVSESDHEWECVGISTAGTTYKCKKCYKYMSIPFKEDLL